MMTLETELSKKKPSNKKKFKFRALSNRELLIAFNKTENSKLDYVLSVGVIGYDSFNWEEIPAGVQRTLFEAIWTVTCGDKFEEDIKATIDPNINPLVNEEDMAVALIPGLTYEILQNTDRVNYTRYLALGQKIIELSQRQK